MTKPDYQRLAIVFAAVMTRMVLSAGADEETQPDADHRLVKGVNRRPGRTLP